MAKKRVVVLYGGRADEHSISCISTAGVLGAMDTERFEPIPVGITKDGKWIINGEDPRGWNLDGGELPTVKITPESRPVMLDPSRGQDGFFIGEPSHINSAETFNALLVQAAIFEYGIFGDGPVGAEYVLHIDVYVVEQHFFQCIKIAVDCIRCQWVIFIKVEHYYITEAQPFFFVHAHEG